MEIKLATESDIDRIKQIYYECSADMQTKFGLDHWSNPYPQDVLKRRINNGMVYMVLQHSIQIGTFMLVPEYPESYINAVEEDDTSFLYLSRLAILPETQSKGIGSRALGKAEEIAKSQGAEVVRLDILSNFKKLEKFYIKNGYNQIGTGKTRRFSITFMEKKLL